jgi:hypothetical protein
MPWTSPEGELTAISRTQATQRNFLAAQQRQISERNSPRTHEQADAPLPLYT